MKLILIFFVLCSFNVLLTLQDRAQDVILKFINKYENDLHSWRIPQELSSNYVYYWSGFDEDGRPLWIGEFGKWDIRGMVSKGNQSEAEFDKYVDMVVYNVVSSLDWNTTDGHKDFVGLVDMDKFDYRQMSHLPTVAYILKKFRYLEPIINTIVHHAYVINANYMGERLVQLLRPILGQLMSKLEVYGTNKGKWQPRILNRLPKEQLPKWYGGDPDFKPVKSFG